MHAHRPTRFARSAAATGLAAALLMLVGCAPAPADDPAAPEAVESGSPATEGDCAGVRVVVEFGALGGDPIDACAETSTEITAVEAFQLAGVQLTEGQAYPGAICRVAGEPEADAELSYNGESDVEECAALGPVWAYWGLFVDSGEGWSYAEEGAATQSLAPGEGVAFAWQFGDTAEALLPSV